MRDEKGRFVKGYKMTEEERQKNSEAQIRYQDKMHTNEFDYPELKRCSNCNQWKNTRADFYKVKHKRVNGKIALYPSPACRECERKRMKAWRDERRRMGKTTEDHRRWRENEDKEKRRRYKREWDTIQRRKRGQKVVGPWLKYRETSRSDSLPIDPIADWLTEQLEKQDMSISEASRRVGCDDKRIRTILNRSGQAQVTSDFVERILMAIDPDSHLSFIYPELYPELNNIY